MLCNVKAIELRRVGQGADTAQGLAGHGLSGGEQLCCASHFVKYMYTTRVINITVINC